MYNYTLVGATLGSYPRDRMRNIHDETHAALIALLESGKYRPMVERCVSFDDVPVALTDLAQRRTMGRVWSCASAHERHRRAHGAMRR